jgi:hypothetical protein
MNNIIICDTREKGNDYILKYFDKVNQDYIVSKLDAGDYMIYKNYKTIIDKKAGLLELAGNLCRTSEHERVKREISKARELGCVDFIFLICENKIKTVEDIANWTNKNTQVKGSTLLKVMTTMKERYGVKFIIVPKKEMGQKIVELLINN